MSAIGPGDVLEAVKSWSQGRAQLRTGQIYRCEEVVVDVQWTDAWCESCRANPVPGVIKVFGSPFIWCICFFKPGGYRPDAQIERLLKQPTREHERA